MAQELAMSATVAYEDAFGVTATIDIPDILRTLSTKKVLHTKQSVGTSEEALALGDISTRGVLVLINRDETNFVNVKVATGGAIFAKLLPEGWCIVPLGSGAQSPYAIADTAECEVEIFLCAV